jgi:malonate-semialdehyde dehydrogenase (acetylating)/methylmalonate-semialdehyde dehydrogenase
MNDAIQSASQAQREWGSISATARARVLFKFRDLAIQRIDDLARAVSTEHGKIFSDAKGSVQRGLEVIDFCCGAPHLLKGEYSHSVSGGIDIFSLHQPLGVVAAITPFNFPAMVPLWMLGPALMAGNAVVLKPSERTPSCPLIIAEILTQAGLPDGVLQVVHGDASSVNLLITHPTVKAVSFVGSTPVARHIYANAALHGKRAQAFGGAKNHMIIMPDADIDEVANALIGAAFGSAGERCMAISVAVPVGEDTAESLRSALIPKIKALRVGGSFDEDVDMGPLVTDTHRQNVLQHINTGIEEGANLLIDGRNLRISKHTNGYFLGPTLFDNVLPSTSIYKKEIFGPVLSIVRADGFEEAMRLPSEHEFGNGVSIFTADGDAARNFAHHVEVGMVGVNVPIPVPLAFHTFGGWKNSAFTDTNMYGTDAFRFYTRTKTVTTRWRKGAQMSSAFIMPTLS